MVDLITAISTLVASISSLIAVLKGRESKRRGRIIARAQHDPYLRLRLEKMLEDGTLEPGEIRELEKLLRE